MGTTQLIFCNKGDTRTQQTGGNGSQGSGDTHSGIDTNGDLVVMLKLRGDGPGNVVLSWHRLEIMR